MILLDCYCTLTYTNVSLAFFASFGFACRQQLIVNCEMLKEILQEWNKQENKLKIPIGELFFLISKHS